MADSMKFHEFRSSLKSKGLLRLVINETITGKFWTGEYIHRAGIVTILRQLPDRMFPRGYTRLDAVVDGRLVYRTWERFWTDRAIPKLARQLLGVEPHA